MECDRRYLPELDRKSDLMKRVNSCRTVLGFLLILISVVFIIFSVLVSWVLRDGLGPDAIESHGLIAIQRFLRGVAPMILIASLIGAIGLWLSSSILRHTSRKRGTGE
jgi:CDP-diglyceride synthetase